MNKDKFKNIKERLKNIWFWLGLAGVAGTAAGIDATTLTNWNLLFNSILEVLKNPYLLGCTISSCIRCSCKSYYKRFKR